MLLDSASMYFRAFFGVPEITDDEGTPVNAVRGFMDFISRLVEQYDPDQLVCCWDNDWRPAWRVDLLPTYKTHRVVAEVASGPDIEEVPDPLEVQVPVILEVLDAFGICVRGADGYEADDVIGTLATGAGGPSTWSPVTATCSRSSTTRPGSACSTSRAAWATMSGSTTRGYGPSTASTPPSTPTSRRSAATPPMACRAWPGSGRRRRRRCSAGSATWPGSSRRPRTPTPTWARDRAARSRRPPTTSRWPRASSPWPASSTWTGRVWTDRSRPAILTGGRPGERYNLDGPALCSQRCPRAPGRPALVRGPGPA